MYGLSNEANLNQSNWEGEASTGFLDFGVKFLENILPTKLFTTLSNNRKERQAGAENAAMTLNQQNIGAYQNQPEGESNTGIYIGIAVVLVFVIGVVIYVKRKK